ncbi:discoidin domain-containing protein [Aquabacterium sp. OR-4]|uniref:discoidin domain-containing protein n=1 Tax=Aquabacterium sp. OR-4 TaxID=2978127 RepID=UPI0021B32E6D|nr:discoidin domain-containing protein [Aquabacterium sp. OR-4]MDT7833812.1 discoidin domain-containing protein [Aquabacterium sp. OR-4]
MFTPTLRAAALAACLLPGLAHAVASGPVTLTELPGVSATASSCYQSSDCAPGRWSAVNVFDHLAYAPGVGGNAWNAGTWASASAPAWVRVDLGRQALIERVSLRFTDNRGGWNGYTNVYELRGSADGQAWQLLGSGTLVDITGNADALTDTHQWAAGSQPLLRALEYRVVGGSHWAALDEMEVLGTPLSAVPEPGHAALLASGLGALAWLARRRGPRG